MIKRMTIKAEDWPNGEPKAYEMKKGDILYFFGEAPGAVGEKYMDNPAIISEILYEPRKWWQFWKKKKQIGYTVEWI